MIREVHLRRSDFNEIPWKFEAGTPAVGDAIGLGVAADYLHGPGHGRRPRARARPRRATRSRRCPREVPDIELYGPMDPALRGGVVPFNLPGHPPARRRPGPGPLRHRGPRRPPLHDAAPRAARPRGDRAGVASTSTRPARTSMPSPPASRSSASSTADGSSAGRDRQVAASPARDVRARRVASRPSIVPAMSASERFWLSFHLPSTRSMTISTPTIALQLALDVRHGRVVDRPRRRARRPRGDRLRRRTLASTQAGSSWMTSRP